MTGRRVYQSLLLVATLGVMALAPLRAGSIVSTFDSGAEGWTIQDLRSLGPYEPPVGNYTVNWAASGGREGGYIQRGDPTSNAFSFAAPAAFLGDRSGFYGGFLRFSLKTTLADWPSDNVVVLVGPQSQVLVAAISPLPGTTWTDYRIPLVEESFRKNTLGGAAVTREELTSALAGLKALRISAEYGSQVVETTGLDSVALISPGGLVIGGRDASGPLVDKASLWTLFTVYGAVVSNTGGTLVINDGNGAAVTVEQSGLTAGTGDYIRATGVLWASPGGARLTAAAGTAEKLN